MKRPIIRVYKSYSTRSGGQVYHGPHSQIPSVGDHVGVQTRDYEVLRVEHVLGVPGLQAHVYISEEAS